MGLVVSGPPPPIYRGTATPFDVAAVSGAIDRAANSLKPGERGALTVQATNETGFGAGLVIRGPWKSEVLGTLTKPRGGGWGWSVGARVAFLAGLPDYVHALILEPPTSTHAQPTWLDWYWLFRANGNGRAASAVKATAAVGGLEVRFYPEPSA